MAWVETIVCSGKKGSDARLRRMLKARQEFKRAPGGLHRCVVGISCRIQFNDVGAICFVSEGLGG